ncbi:hypothetical protein WOLCODRAFT_23494 [Wolfiporia cocos MD-104 SS10]|uniref:Uncharacterized protein n=1 Tax=Wolfiporia cocos (strain MD-104) TaxID=742152 RepID=A0A2H3JFQ3_WOLCO|nr:hypothetical protein WOLCODRAFT_23494 [Wolfiporia cocos MD-104 SS10]
MILRPTRDILQPEKLWTDSACCLRGTTSCVARLAQKDARPFESQCNSCQGDLRQGNTQKAESWRPQPASKWRDVR